MREIKFRGKRIDNGEWVYGHYHFANWYDPKTLQIVDTTHSILPIDRQDSHRVNPATVGQYTGLRDKNGQEIYEGDICKDARGFRFVVVWDDNARFLGRGIGAQREYIRYVGQEPAVEVIGNIHDNPELLEVSV